jgi:hypothetical protein
MDKYINKDNISIVYKSYKQKSFWIYHPEKIKRYFFGLYQEVEPEHLKYHDCDLMTTTNFSNYIIENNIVYDKPILEIHLNSGDKHIIRFNSNEELNKYIDENPWILLNLMLIN